MLIGTSVAIEILKLAFAEFLKSGSGKLAEKFTDAAVEKIKQLHQTVRNRLWGHPKAESAITAIEQGSEEELSRLAVYLKDLMEDDEQFASQVQALAQEIKVGKLQDNSSMTQNNYDSSTGYQIKNENIGGENYSGNITINKT